MRACVNVCGRTSNKNSERSQINFFFLKQKKKESVLKKIRRNKLKFADRNSGTLCTQTGYRSICLTCELTQSDNFLAFVRSPRSVSRVTPEAAFLPRLARDFIAWQVSDTNAPRPYFINPPVCILPARVSSLIPTGKRWQPPLLAPA